MKKIILIIFLLATTMQAQSLLMELSGKKADGIFDVLKVSDYQVISYFDEGIGNAWTVSVGDTALDDNINHLYSTKGIKLFSTNSSTTITLELGTPLDMTNSHFVVSYYLPDTSKISSLEFRAYNGTNYYRTFSGIATQKYNGWNHYDVIRDLYSKVGTPVWSNITKIVIIATAKSPTLEITFNRLLKIDNNNPEGIVCFAFDDGADVTYTEAKSYLDLYGYTGTTFIIPTFVNTAGNLSLTQLKEMKKDGWEIAGHGVNALPSLTLNELRSELKATYNFIKNNGLGEKYLTFAYPGGQFNNVVIAELSKYFSFARTISNYNSPVLAASQHRVFGHSMMEADIPTCKAYIDSAAKYKDICVFGFHGTTDLEDFGAVVDYAHSQNVRILNFGDAMMGDTGTSHSHLPLTPILTNVVGASGYIQLNINSGVYDSIYIYKDTVSVAEPTTLLTVIPKQSSYIDSAVVQNGIYSYRLRTRNIVGFSEYSSVQSDTAKLTYIINDNFDDGNYTGWTVQSGTYTVTDSVLVCSSAGVITIPSDVIDGVWEFDFYKGGSGNNLFINFIDSDIDAGGDGYSFAFTTLGDARLNQIGVTVLAQTAVNYILSNIWYSVKIIRTSAGVTTTYLKGGSLGSTYVLMDVSGGSGTNPFTNTVYSSSSYIVLDLDNGDKIDNIKVNAN